MNHFTYYHQDRKPVGLRRYQKNQQEGEKWDLDEHKWTRHCAPRRAAEITGDRIIDQREAEDLFPGSTR